MSVVWQTVDNFQSNWLKSFSQKDLLENLVKSQWIKIDGNQSDTIESAKKAAKEKKGLAAESASNENNAKKKKKRKRVYRKIKKMQPTEKILKEYSPIVDCSYNVPRITARLEGLMGTNVVRLTDRAYMQQLRQNHEADCNARLQSRIEKRKAAEKERQNYLVFRGHYKPENCPAFLKVAHSIALAQEMERVRALVIEGKLTKMPEDLASHPVFKANFNTNEIIAQRRSKLKTNREKNAERLMRQGAKWERDRLIFEQTEKEKQEEIKTRQNEQSGLEDKYRQENAVRGLDLLRIHDKRWKTCELGLKKFLETERASMRQRSMRQSFPFSSDPLDIRNVARNRKKFRVTQDKVRKHIEETKKSMGQINISNEPVTLQTVSRALQRKSSFNPHNGMIQEKEERFLHSDYGLQTDEDLSAEEIDGEPETTTHENDFLLKDMDHDIKNGLILTKEQFDALHYEDPLIAKLKQTENVHELYQVAREIICPDSDKFIEKVQEEIASTSPH